jgi:3-hydroxypropanoate dehydrogenase
MTTALAEDLALLFTDARTHHAWTDQPVDDALLAQLYDLVKWAPTGGNAQPLRVVFVKSAEAKARLKPALMPGNVDKTMNAPVTAIIAHDVAFHEKLPQLFPARPEMKDALGALPDEIRQKMGLQSATLQAGYLILAARALGLDVGPMGGFDAAAVDAAFFPDGKWKSSLLINLGHAEKEKVHPRLPRLRFEEACRVE